MKYRIGVIGVRRGANYVQQFSTLPNAEITALCDLDQNSLAQVGEPLRVPDHCLFTHYDDLLNAPSEMGEMPPGWTAPSISVPNPIDVGDQLEEASKEIGPDMIQLR